MGLKFLPNPSYCSHQYRSTADMTSTLETVCTLRFVLRSKKIYAGEQITSPEILLEPLQMQDDSINTPNSQFRLVLLVMACMLCISSLESDSTPLLFSPTPTSSPAHVPTPNLPQDQPPPLPLSPTSNLTSTCSTSSQHDELLPGSPKLFSPTPTTQDEWSSPPPLPQRSPCTGRRHKLHNYTSLASINGSYVCVAMLALSHPTPQPIYSRKSLIRTRWDRRVFG